MMDLDGFKAVNDSHGHEEGDALLRTVADRLDAAFQGVGKVYRIGGDEFVAVVESGSVENATNLARTAADRVSAPYRLTSGDSAKISLSVGLARAPSDGRTPPELLKRLILRFTNPRGAGRL